MPRLIPFLSCLAALSLPAVLRAAPLVLYDPAASSTPDLKSSTTAIAPQACGLSTPCTDMNTSAQASLAAPLWGNLEYGMSGEASAGVSNHGQGGSIGVLGWVRDGDTTLSLGVSVGTVHFSGPRSIVVLPPAHP
jgi:hypothetical protein